MTERKCQHKKALELFQKIGDKATPADIDKHVGGTGSYYSKHMSVMRRWGFEFDVEKDGRMIVSYTLIKEPANAAEYRTGRPVKEKKVKVKKTVAKKAVKAKTAKKATDVKAKNFATIKAVAEKRKEEKKVIESAPTPTSYAVDEDWDSVENVDIAALV